MDPALSIRGWALLRLRGGSGIRRRTGRRPPSTRAVEGKRHRQGPVAQLPPESICVNTGSRNPLVASISRSISRPLRCFRSMSCRRAKHTFSYRPVPASPVFPVLRRSPFAESSRCPMLLKPLPDEQGTSRSRRNGLLCRELNPGSSFEVRRLVRARSRFLKATAMISDN